MQPRHLDPRFASCPVQPGIEQLRWYIRATAQGTLNVTELMEDFRAVHEAAERAGEVAYANDDEARAIWDVMWAVEYASKDITAEDNPDEWLIPEEVLITVKRAADKLR